MSLLSARLGWALAGLLGIALLASLAGVVRGGPLDPSNAPAPSMKSLAELPPAWDRSLSASGADPCNTERFLCVGGSTAVLDRQTGLVWERTVGSSNVTWVNALNTCVGRFAGNRKGWRVPTVSELRSLIDDSQSSPALPAGHPFNLGTATADSFWTVTTDVQVGQGGNAWAVSMANGAGSIDTKGIGKKLWCVRGGSRFE